MDVGTNIDSGLPDRGVTGGLARAALAAPAGAPLRLSADDLFEIGEIFKKTPYAPGLKLRGRYVAKDMDEVGAIPLLMKTLFDHGHADRDCTPVAGLTTAEDLKSVKPKPANCGGVGRKGTPVPEGAVVKVAGMLQEGDIIEIGADGETFDLKLSDADLADHETKWRPRATNFASGALWTFAQQIGPAVDGAVTHPGAAHEKQCYADI